jgi:hypothetical protein
LIKARLKNEWSEEVEMIIATMRKARRPRFILKPRVVRVGFAVSETHYEQEQRKEPRCEGGVCFLRWKPVRKTA